MLELQQIVHTDASIYTGAPRPKLLNEQRWDGRAKQEGGGNLVASKLDHVKIVGNGNGGVKDLDTLVLWERFDRLFEFLGQRCPDR